MSDPPDTEALYLALLAAFPKREDFARMVAFQFRRRAVAKAESEGREPEPAAAMTLTAIAGDADQGDATFKVIEWTESRGLLRALIDAARAANPGNPQLRAYAERVERQELSD